MKQEKENVRHSENRPPFVVIRNQRKPERQEQRPVLQTIHLDNKEDPQIEGLLPQPLSYGHLYWEPDFTEQELWNCGFALRELPTPGPETLIDYRQFD